MKKFICDPVDPDLILKDLAMEHPSNEMRAMANLTIGMGIDEAYYSVQELREAISLLDQNQFLGKAPLSEILSADCRDYQRAIFFCLAGRGLSKMLKLLTEFEQALETRGRVDRSLGVQGIEARALRDPYISEFAFGPVCDPGFKIAD